MRHIILLCAIAACGPLPVSDPGRTIAVSVENDYAESIFTIDVVQRAPAGVTLNADNGPTETGVSHRLMDMKRVAGSATERIENVMRVNQQAELAFTIAATSLGQTSTFTGIAKVADSSSSKNVLGFTYDYDLALADFRMRFGWRL